MKCFQLSSRRNFLGGCAIVIHSRGHLPNVARSVNVKCWTDKRNLPRWNRNTRQGFASSSSGRVGKTQLIEWHKVTIAPHKKLPEVVLGYIFTLCCPTELRFPLQRSNVHFTLCAVCSAWRRIALDAARMWNEVILTTYNRSTCNTLLMVVQFWLARAGNRSRSNDTLSHLEELVLDYTSSYDDSLRSYLSLQLACQTL